MGPALSKGRLSAVKPSRQALAAPGASQRRAYSGIVRELVGARTRGGKLKPPPGADRPGLGGSFPWMAALPAFRRHWQAINWRDRRDTLVKETATNRGQRSGPMG